MRKICNASLILNLFKQYIQVQRVSVTDSDNAIHNIYTMTGLGWYYRDVDDFVIL